ncbi:MAG: DUF1295 domain-containing protein [Gammaproteobacteria bacterium]
MNLVLIPSMFWGLAVVAAMMFAVWLASLVRRDASLVDRVWGFGFVLLGWFYFAVSPSPHLLPAVLATVWGLRLSVHLTRRNWGHGEDRRYADMRKKHGGYFALFSLFSVYLVQAVLLWIIAFPLLMGARGILSGPGGAALVVAGVVLWLIGFLFEAVGDHQLARFKRDPANRNKVLDTGLWHYTRHPNYFGDMLVWWGLYLLAAAAGAWWTIFAPILMTLFLARVSGVTLLEKHLNESRPGYRDYVNRTSALIPLPPRHS